MTPATRTATKDAPAHPSDDQSSISRPNNVTTSVPPARTSLPATSSGGEWTVAIKDQSTGSQDDIISHPLTSATPCQVNVRGLPAEVWVQVFSFLPRKDLIRASSTCHAWRRLAFTSPRLWRLFTIDLGCNVRARCLSRIRTRTRTRTRARVRTYSSLSDSPSGSGSGGSLSRSRSRTRSRPRSSPRSGSASRRAWMYCRRMGHFLRRLKINGPNQDRCSCPTAPAKFRTVLINLKPSSRLTSFRVATLDMRRACSPLIHDTATHLTSLLRNQRQLRVFQMSGSHWPWAAGRAVLEALAGSSADTLTQLRIKRFFAASSSIVFRRCLEADSGFQEGLRSFRHLTRLSVDYFCLTDDTVKALAGSPYGGGSGSSSNSSGDGKSGNTTALTQLSLFAENPIRHEGIVRSSSWQILTKACPRLKVTVSLRINGPSSSSTMLQMMDPHLRLAKFRLCDIWRREQPDRLASLLHHLTLHFRNCLERVHLDCSKQTFFMDQQLIRLARHCPRLQKVKVVASFHNSNIQKEIKDIIRQHQRRH